MRLGDPWYWSDGWRIALVPEAKDLPVLWLRIPGPRPQDFSRPPAELRTVLYELAEAARTALSPHSWFDIATELPELPDDFVGRPQYENGKLLAHLAGDLWLVTSDVCLPAPTFLWHAARVLMRAGLAWEVPLCVAR